MQALGGLGNQLFQYAIGRALSLRHDVPLLLDLSCVKTEGPMAFCLDALVSHYRIAEKEQIAPHPTTSHSGYKRARRAVRDTLRYWSGRAPKRLNQQSPCFEPRVMTQKPPIYLSGYWQTQKYFVDYADTIRRDIQLPYPSDAMHTDLLVDSSVTPISMHVRRGDYVGNPTHPCCSPQYYRDAAQYLAERCRNEPVFIVFSDDADWVKANITLPFRTVFTNEDGENTNYQDMALMKACRSHIIANSSFSWWGAWLNTAADKTVVAPAQWFGGVRTRELDIVPADWVVL